MLQCCGRTTAERSCTSNLACHAALQANRRKRKAPAAAPAAKKAKPAPDFKPAAAAAKPAKAGAAAAAAENEPAGSDVLVLSSKL